MFYDNLQFDGISIRKNASNIIICDTQSDSIDIIGFHNYCINLKGMHGIPYHYIIMRSGDIHNTKPINYESELYPQINNDICIALEGNTNNADLTDSQKSSLVSLVGTLLDKECLPYFAVVTLSDLVGGLNPGPKTNWQSIKDSITSNWVSVDKSRIPLVNMSMNTNNNVFQKQLAFYILKTKDVVNRIAHLFGTDVAKIKTPTQLLNNTNTISTSSTFIPGTPIVFKTNPIYQTQALVTNQAKKAALILEVANNKINTLQNTIAANKLTATLASNKTKTIKNNLTITDNIPQWQNEDIKMPGYSKAKLTFTDVNTGSSVSIPFVIGPLSFTDTRATQQQMNKTSAGWFVMRMGQQIGGLSLTGYMLDTEKIKERQSFITAYNTYIRDVKDSYFQYQNKYTTTLYMEGRTYLGFVQSISLSSSAAQQFIYQYNINFTVLSETSSYNTLLQSSSYYDQTQKTKTASFTINVPYIGDTLYSILAK